MKMLDARERRNSRDEREEELKNREEKRTGCTAKERKSERNEDVGHKGKKE